MAGSYLGNKNQRGEEGKERELWVGAVLQLNPYKPASAKGWNGFISLHTND
jgi:hypothetical protein